LKNEINELKKLKEEEERKKIINDLINDEINVEENKVKLPKKSKKNKYLFN